MTSARHREAGILRLYRGCLALYPAEFREEYGREMCLVFADRWREVRSPAGMAMVWLEALRGILHEAPKEHLHMILQDLRYSLRILRKDATVSVAALAILALGIGATTLVFSLANGLLLRPLPYADPGRLVAVEEYSPKDPNEQGQISFPNAIDFAARAQLIENLGVYTRGSALLSGEGGAETVLVSPVSDGVFRALGVTPVLGRIFTHQEASPGGPGVVILSEELWNRRYTRDPEIVGRGIDFASGKCTVVGVMPEGFHFPERAELWVPIQNDPVKTARTDYFLGAIARLKPGATTSQATSEIDAILEQIHREYPAANNNWRARVTPLRTFEAADYQKQVIALLVAVALLLAIACANVSNLLLVKASGRSREMAVRTAMGASRRRLVRQLTLESLLLALAGGVLGTGLAWIGIPALLSLIPVELPRWMIFRPDYRVWLFALGVSLVTSLAFGLAPAWGASAVDLTRTLKEGGRAGSGGPRQRRLRNVMVAGEVALSVILLAGAGLSVRSFIAMRDQKLGYDPRHVVSLQIGYPPTRYPDRPKQHAMIQGLTEQISALPGVTSAAFSSGVPLHDGWSRIYTVEGRPRDLKDMPFVNHIVVAPGYFRTLGIRLLEGRDFAEEDYDRQQQQRILIVTQGFERENWPGESAVGKRIRFGPPARNEPWHTIVGVVADNRHEQLKAGGRPNVYLPYSPDITPDSLLVRAAGDPGKIVSALRARIRDFDKAIAVRHVFTLPQLIERASWQDRFLAVLLMAFAFLALTLAAVGLYASLSYTVSLDTREIGIRMALGASRSSVQSMLMRQGVTVAAAGLVIGIVGALSLTRLLRSQLFEISPADPVTYAITPLVLMSVAALAAFWPARRATKVDPAVALRWE
ncbi:MAG TPA: ABC transporter permease [Bryobacteraceae bacterium]|nr:ABC transporter permease [Bryobacteraceae bacterium]